MCGGSVGPWEVQNGIAADKTLEGGVVPVRVLRFESAGDWEIGGGQIENKVEVEDILAKKSEDLLTDPSGERGHGGGSIGSGASFSSGT